MGKITEQQKHTLYIAVQTILYQILHANNQQHFMGNFEIKLSEQGNAQGI